MTHHRDTSIWRNIWTFAVLVLLIVLHLPCYAQQWPDCIPLKSVTVSVSYTGQSDAGADKIAVSGSYSSSLPASSCVMSSTQPDVASLIALGGYFYFSSELTGTFTETLTYPTFTETVEDYKLNGIEVYTGGIESESPLAPGGAGTATIAPVFSFGASLLCLEPSAGLPIQLTSTGFTITGPCNSENALGGVDEGTLNIVVSFNPTRLEISPTFTSSFATAGAPFTSPLFVASGGVPPYIWGFKDLPVGLNLVSAGNQATIQGVPSAPTPDMSIDIDGELMSYSGTFFQITVTDQTGVTATAYDAATISFSLFVPLPESTKREALYTALTKSLEGFAIALGVVACEALPACAPEGTVELPELTLTETALMKSAATDFVQALDPPDSNYTSIATPPSVSVMPIQASGALSQSIVSAFNNWAENESSETSLNVALITSLNRASGAYEAGNTFWQLRQLQAAKWYSLQLSRAVGKEPVLRQAVASVLSGTEVNLAIDPSAVSAALQRVAQSGLSSTEVNFFTSAGITPDQLQLIQTMIPEANGINFAPTNLASVFSDSAAITGLEQHAKGYGIFGADRNNDGVVNCADLKVVTAHFGATQSSLSYNPMADVNMDGVVNVLDLVLVSQQLPAGTLCQ
jgi:hypothetical protein